MSDNAPASPAPPVSPDGNFWWDGGAWLPMPAQPPLARPRATDKGNILVASPPEQVKGLSRDVQIPKSLKVALMLVAIVGVIGVTAAVIQGSNEQKQRNDQLSCFEQQQSNPGTVC